MFDNNIMNQNRYQKNTTFSKRPVVPQIASYLLFTFETILFFSVIVPNFNSESSKIICSVLYSLTLVALIISSILSSSCDPSDPVMIKNRNSSNQQFEQFRKKYKGTLLYCDHCRSLVQQKSRHCKKCDRCVCDFDHHCMWINNCVGELNYKYFFAMILSAFCNVLVYVSAVSALTMQHRFQKYFGGFVAAWISGGINSIFLVLLTNLIILHLYLISKGVSTYEFIMAQREQERKQKENVQDKVAAVQIIRQQKESNSGQQNSQQHFHKQIQLATGLKQIANTHVVRVQSNKSSSSQSVKIIKQQNFHDGMEVRSILFKQKEQSQKSARFSKHQPSLPPEDNSNEDSDAQSGVGISQLFTRNKSLKFIIGKSDSSKPRKIKRLPYHSLLIGERQHKQDAAISPKKNKR